ncbi:MAG: amidase, partial [Rhizobiaceae bacterium]|nr:amidase [Rhizobiaceae bacterium]
MQGRHLQQQHHDRCSMTVRPLPLAALLRDLESGALTSQASIASARERIAAADGTIGAFVRLAPETSVGVAARAEGPLRGVPLGVKDIFDTADMATEHGSPIYVNHR